MLAPKQAEKNVCIEGPRNDPNSYFPCQELKIIMRFVFDKTPIASVIVTFVLKVTVRNLSL